MFKFRQNSIPATLRATWSNRVFPGESVCSKRVCRIEWFTIIGWMLWCIFIFPSRNVKSLNLRSFAPHHIYAEFCWWTESKITNTIYVYFPFRFLHVSCVRTQTQPHTNMHTFTVVGFNVRLHCVRYLVLSMHLPLLFPIKLYLRISNCVRNIMIR